MPWKVDRASLDVALADERGQVAGECITASLAVSSSPVEADLLVRLQVVDWHPGLLEVQVANFKVTIELESDLKVFSFDGLEARSRAEGQVLVPGNAFAALHDLDRCDEFSVVLEQLGDLGRILGVISALDSNNSVHATLAVAIV